MNRPPRPRPRFSGTPNDAKLALEKSARAYGLTRRVSTDAREGFEWDPHSVLFIETDTALKARIDQAIAASGKKTSG
jgi:hypothetical protein